MKILHATDGSPHAETAGRLLNRIAFPANAVLIVANVVENLCDTRFGTFPEEKVRDAMHRAQVDHANVLLKSSVDQFSGQFATIRHELLKGNAADEITKLAESEQVDLVAVGARGMNALERFLMGSTSEKILNHAPGSVLVAHRPNQNQSASSPAERLRLLVAFDASPAAIEAVDVLTQYPLKDSVEIELLYVHSLVTSFRADILQRASQQWQDEESKARAALDLALRRLNASGTKNTGMTIHEAPDVAAEILRVAENWRADIVLAGDTGKSGVDRFLLGSVCMRLTRHSPCSVWITRKKRTKDS